jgi:hypothetical protein
MAMTIVEAALGITGGVDTHLDKHVAAALDPLGSSSGSSLLSPLSSLHSIDPSKGLTSIGASPARWGHKRIDLFSDMKLDPVEERFIVDGASMGGPLSERFEVRFAGSANVGDVDGTEWN